MSMWSRFRDVMKANLHSMLERSDDPERTARQYMQQLTSDIGQVKAETAAVVAEESRSKRAWDESSGEIAKLQRYAEKSVQNGDQEGALRFLEKKAQLAPKHSELQAAHERAAAKADVMKQMQIKLTSDLNTLQTRYADIQNKLHEAQTLQQSNSNHTYSSANNALHDMQQKANQALNEAEALAEVRGGAQPEEDLDVLIARLEQQMNAQPDHTSTSASTPQEELAAIQQQYKG
ncbi:PspA/IM30 family protein [Paenibacillus sp. WLX2291]|uniref:PspA/IM30 family protein n=1 Tax=Paenibacillus sp. WLX2291 TaxID=3296934 RepID=UPI003984379C